MSGERNRDGRDGAPAPVRLVDAPTADEQATPEAAHRSVAHAPAAGPFPHEKLDAYRVAVQMVALANRVAAQIPRGYRNIADHLQRAGSNTVLLLAEGANRRGAALKRQRFTDSRGECGEVGAAADLVRVLGLGSPADAEELKQLASRVSAMLTRLIARLE
jgi:four helix bundle protein